MTTIPITFTINVPIEAIKQAISEAIQQGISGKPEPEQTVSRDEYAKMNGMNRETVSRKCKANQLRHTRIGRKLRIYVNQGESSQVSIKQSNLKKAV